MRGFILFGWLACGMVPAVSAADIDHTMSLSVVQIRAYPGPGKMFFGSGVVIGPDQVATNCHVTRLARKVTVSKGPIQFAAISQQADPRRDICLLNAPGVPFPKAEMGTAGQLSVGQTLYFYGYPRGIGIAFSQGHVEALHPFLDSRVIETSADFTLGGSGGGVFDERGKLVGLATFLSSGHAGAYYAIPSDWIMPVASRESHKIEPFSGLTFWEDVAALPAFLKRPGQ